jgi:AcrR family transcriptional regulator
MKVVRDTKSAPRRKTGRPLSFDRDVALEQAMLTFWRFGYETTSIADLTSAMNITAPSIYTAFGDKKQLFLEAAHLYAGDAAERALRIDSAASAYDAAREMLLEAAKAFTGKTTPKGCLLASATAAGSTEAADVQRAVADIRRSIAAQLRTRIERDITAKRLPRDTDAASLADLVIAVVQGMSVLARDGASRARLNDIGTTSLRAWPVTRTTERKTKSAREGAFTRD